MTHEDEYHDNIVTMLELVWGEGYMAPGGPGNVSKMLNGIHTQGKRILAEACRALKSGGHLSCYDWLKSTDEYSDDMRYWIFCYLR